MSRDRRPRVLFGPFVAAVTGVSVAVAVAPTAAVADPAPTIAPALPPGGSFVPVTPTRVLDTRTTIGRSTSAYADLDPALPSARSVDAVLVNITVVDAVAPGYVVAGYDEDGPTPTSNGNYVAGGATATSALVRYFGADLRVETSTTADVVVDVQGYVTTPQAATTASFTPLAVPRRVADSRIPLGVRPFGAGQTQSLEVRSAADLPADATAVIANLTVASATEATYVTGWSGTGARPAVSSVNADAGSIVANRALLPLDGSGDVSLYNFAGRTDLVVDVVGYLSPDPSGSYYAPANVDSRALDAHLAAGEPTGVSLRRSVADPSVDDLAPLTAVWLTVAGDQPVGQGFLTVRPGDITSATGTSDVNMQPSRAVANAGPVRVSAVDGTVAVISSIASRVVVDFAGWFRRAPSDAAADGIWTTSTPYGEPRATSARPGDLPAAFAHAVFGDDDVASALLPDGTVDQVTGVQDPSGKRWTSPEAVPGLAHIVSIVDQSAAAPDDLFALDDAGGVFVRGTNAYGEMAMPPPPTASPPLVSTAQIPLQGRAVAVHATSGVGFATMADGTVVSWGVGRYDLLGRADTATPWVPAPVALPAGPPLDIAGNGSQVFAIDATGRTWWWGAAHTGSGSDVTHQETPTPFGNGCDVARSLTVDAMGAWELCADGTVDQLGWYDELSTSRHEWRTTGVAAIAPDLDQGVRALLTDGRVVDLSWDDATPIISEAGFSDVTAIAGDMFTAVTRVGS